MWTSEDALKELVNRRFRAIAVGNLPGQPEIMLFTRRWDDEPFVDEVIIRGEDDATACRHLLAGDIDRSERKDYVWYSDGSVVEVVDEIIFHLPHPARPEAPKLVIPTPDSLLLPPGVHRKARA
ncbi:hypothetical protein [Amycolatopsis sp. NPDC004079]|uniref:hypothetical protein n=1 Tax=Amycolatopsis sp. NPDC004079 TaxID=3154549 RepID=UPI0033AB9682